MRGSDRRAASGSARRSLLRLLPAGLLGAALPAGAQSGFPSRAVRIVVPFPAGGSTDIIARLVAEDLARSWGQPVVVENRAGAGGTLGTDFVAKAPPDGHVIGLSTLATIAIAPSIYPALPYDPQRDLVQVAPLAQSPSVIVVHPSVPARSLAEFIAHARSRPRQLNFSSSGVGVSGHLAGENLAAATGIEIVHVPYRGSAPALAAVASGEVQMTFDTIAGLAPLIQADRVRPLAQSGERRAALLPDVPTLAELGLRQVESYTWFGLNVPAGTPAEVRARISSDTRRALARPEFRTRLATLGFEPMDQTDTEFAAFVRAETEKWGGLARRLNIRIE